ncbi:hypothetical protein E2562_013316 [Oryza meyeriana var. granulata]|uniref:F-box domain-containing protein n=1 Tax=Oryza meyeriana var. granulata TaxID=110450 RepID=A0A6G1D215_9ORYZ|nr:hypothetical protein E2562_013316 [Oryza meyeriana var. granulata]
MQTVEAHEVDAVATLLVPGLRFHDAAHQPVEEDQYGAIASVWRGGWCPAGDPAVGTQIQLLGPPPRRRHRATSLAAPVTLPDDNDLLTEILLRLPPRPSSLPRAPLVCRRWHRLISDPAFHCRFRACHRNPPIVGVFAGDVGNPFFRSVLDPLDHIPMERFWMRLAEDKGGHVLGRWRLFGCRHGRVLLFNRKQNEIVLWDPDTGDHRRVAVPPEIDGEEKMMWNGALLCAAAADDSHVHGGFSSCPSKILRLLLGDWRVKRSHLHSWFVLGFCFG